VLLIAAVLACCAPAQAAPLGHAGHAILPAPLPGPRALQRLADYPRTLVELDRVSGPFATGLLQRAGGELILPQLQLWRLPSGTARRLLPGLIRSGVVRSVTPDRPLTTIGSSGVFFNHLSDPQVGSEWWLSHVGADRWEPPGAGVPLTIIDSGLDTSHEEFRGRPATILLNRQLVSGDEDELHGTAVASVAAAPTNGIGLVGVYPRARLQSFDADLIGLLTIGDELKGLRAAMAHGRGVVNMSFGGNFHWPVEEQAALAAFGAGSLLVAAAGNEREILSPTMYPANFPHVLTVAATDQNDAVTFFSSESRAIDLAAPGLDIPTAVPRSIVPEGYLTLSGTSFSTPIVAAAAAAIWTTRPQLKQTQLFDLLRSTARDVGRPGRDRDTGFGILDIPAAAATPAPPLDPQEPNEDIYLVRPNGLLRAGHAPLTGPGKTQAQLRARLDTTEDPGDVYRVYLPARGRLSVSVTPTANVNIELWGPGTRTVFERGSDMRGDLLGVSAHPGTASERLVIRNRGSTGRYVYLDVVLGRRVTAASYSLAVRS
jgi:hypothetical protein